MRNPSFLERINQSLQKKRREGVAIGVKSIQNHVADQRKRICIQLETLRESEKGRVVLEWNSPNAMLKLFFSPTSSAQRKGR
jgi:hypothetical protein